MKRLAFALAAAVLGTACGPSTPPCNAGSISVSWSGFYGPTAAAGDQNKACGPAGVSYVDLWLDGGYVARWPCGDYAAGISAVALGTHDLVTEGIAPDGSTIVYRDERSVAVSACGNFAVGVSPAAGSVDLHYAFQSGTTCASASSYMWFTLYDTVAQAVDPATIDASSSLSAKQSFACGPTDPVVTLPTGRYQLTSIQEMVMSAGPVFTQAAYGCHLPTTFDVGSGAQTVINPSLADTGVACL
jgi:hypothetical protein